ncbi:hypothetical protein [Alteromonas gilva]|uniref:Uncharacterized protein n=1 Tax=Alteromonas gilva TaxID=2987522 RepID=A0ABT5L1T4_9ALTE|nr:hypothetical protein [Alteromonas gilva]MDC8830379.1 hypothetical protein [Alteromonas gilva]
MTHSNDPGSIANMAGIQTAIANNDATELKALLGDQQLGTLQKDYLFDLAKLSGNTEVQDIISDAPEKP